MDNAKSLVMVVCALLLTGSCAEQRSESPVKPLCATGATTAEAVRIAEDVLGRMHFAIDKSDPNTGIIRTRPLSGAQFFELWRSDTVGTFNRAQANLQTIRRIAELTFNQEGNKLLISCNVQIQKLSLPEHEAAGSAQAYRMYSLSMPTIQTLRLSEWQKRGMEWMYLGDDTLLAREVLNQIERQLGQPRRHEIRDTLHEIRE